VWPPRSTTPPASQAARSGSRSRARSPASRVQVTVSSPAFMPSAWAPPASTCSRRRPELCSSPARYLVSAPGDGDLGVLRQRRRVEGRDEDRPRLGAPYRRTPEPLVAVPARIVGALAVDGIGGAGAHGAFQPGGGLDSPRSAVG